MDSSSSPIPERVAQGRDEKRGGRQSGGVFKSEAPDLPNKMLVEPEYVQMFGREFLEELLARRSSALRDIEWVAEQLVIVRGIGVSRKQFRELAKSSPSASALGLLLWATKSPLNEADFWKTMYAKTLPNKSQIEAEALHSDDGRRQFQHIRRIRQAIVESGTEDV